MWWGPIWILKTRKFRASHQEDKFRKSMFRRHLTSGKNSLKRLLRRRRSKISFAVAITGNLCPGVNRAVGKVRTLDEWMCSNISLLDQKTRWATFLSILLTIWQQKKLHLTIFWKKNLKIYPPMLWNLFPPSVRFATSLVFSIGGKFLLLFQKPGEPTQVDNISNKAQSDLLFGDDLGQPGVAIKTNANANTDNPWQVGVDCKGTNCLVSFRCHHTPPPCQSDWQVSIWTLGAKLLPFPVAI